MSVFGLKVFETILSTPKTTTTGINVCTILGNDAGANSSLYNTLVGINNYADFLIKFPNAAQYEKDAVSTFFNNNPTGLLSYFPCFKTGIETVTDAQKLEHIRFGIVQIDKRNDIELRFMLVPLMEQLANQPDRTTLFTDVNNLCIRKNWIFFVNSAVSVDTKQKAIDERKLYSSPLGHAAYYYGSYINNDDKVCSLTPYVAAIALRRATEDVANVFKPPAGARFPLQNAKRLQYYIDNEPDYNELKNLGINVMHNLPRYGFCMWGARTMSNDPNILHINTRIAMSVLVKRLELALIPFMYESYDPQGATGREIRRTIESQLNIAFLEGAFSGSTREECYRILEQELPRGAGGNSTTSTQFNQPNSNILTQPTNVTASIRKLYTIMKIYAHFVSATEAIEVNLFNVEDPTIYGVAV